MFPTIKRQSHILLLFPALFLLNACKSFNSNGKSQQFEQLHKKYHGTWQPVYSLSELPIEGNLDGKSSTYMIDELTNFQNGFLDINIIKDNIEEMDYPYLISIPYPVQYFPPESSLGEANFYINYIINSAIWRFKFSPKKEKLLLNENQSSPSDQEEYPFPKSIEIKNEGMLIMVVIEKKLLTAEGWKTVTIKTRYARTSKYN